MKFKRVFTIVTDSVGIGEASDAADFDDVGADTLGHIGEFWKGNFQVPNLSDLITQLKGFRWRTIRKGSSVKCTKSLLEKIVWTVIGK